MDILSYNILQRLEGQRYNEYFPTRPVYAFYSGLNSGPSAAIDFYGANERKPMRTWMRGTTLSNQPVSVSASGQFEVSTNYYWGGSSSAASTSAFSAASGAIGVSAHSDTMFLGNVDLSTEGVSAFASSDNNVQTTHASMGVVLGENSDYLQGIDLLKSGSYLLVDYVGDTTLSAKTTDKGFDWTQLAGLNRLPAGRALGYGDIGYNRKTNTLAFIETDTSTAPATATLPRSRLHIFKNLPQRLQARATVLKQLLEDAIAGRNGSSYEVFDFTWGGSNTIEWFDATRVIPCDDGTFWLARCGYSSTPAGLNLARIYFQLDGVTRAFETIDRLTGSAVYGREAHLASGIRHMRSDDNSMVAVFCQYYYYVSGGLFFFLPRDSAAQGSRYRKFIHADTSYGLSIAPAGGPNFILGLGNNSDAKSRDGTVIDLEANPLNGTSMSPTLWLANVISGYNQSTSNGSSGFLKVQRPLRLTTEWNER